MMARLDSPVPAKSAQFDGPVRPEGGWPGVLWEPCRDLGLSRQGIQSPEKYEKKGPVEGAPFSASKRGQRCLLPCRIDVLPVGLAGLLAGLMARLTRLSLLAGLALLLAGLLARLRLVLVSLLLILLARLILVRHVMSSVGEGLPQPDSEPAPPPSFRRKATVPKVSRLLPHGACEEWTRTVLRPQNKVPNLLPPATCA